MSDPVRFLNAFAHAMAVMTLYPEGHPSREGAVDAAYEMLSGLTGSGSDGNPAFTFLDDEVVFGREPLRELRSWVFGRRLTGVGIQRIEVERAVSREEFEGFLQEVYARFVPGSVESSDARQMRSLGIRFGAVDVQQGEGGWQTKAAAAAEPAPSSSLDLALGEEADAFRWMHAVVMAGEDVPIAEAEAVVRSLALAMHGDSHLVLPLLQLKEFDQYTTTHSLNVSVLSMGLAESLGCRPAEVRAIGVAGLLHDIGKVRIPLEVLTKPGKLNEEERRIMNAHPVEGARILLGSADDMTVAATVAYEHHIMINGGGYPALHYGRACAMASRLVHVCDVYDALCTNRPYRDAWSSEKTIEYLESRAGEEFDRAVVAAFVRTLRGGEAQVRVLTEETTIAVPPR